MRKLLSFVDNSLYKFLERNMDVMPKRFIKLVANYYTDARIRKMYWGKLGVFMGENTFPNLGFQSTSNGEALVFIGNNVSIAPNVTLIPDSSANNGDKIKSLSYVSEKLSKKSKIIIQDEVWIGANVTILPGVKIGTCSIIGAGSIVNKDVESYCIYAGVPARKIRELRSSE
ncbi:acyltransferase [Paenibacillus sp. FSL R7-0331]|uniref:acyltransferase n=1 Tax=Paenibacillus sp. FSL R7-0331 TaxID=1536773 RepID=UPI0022AEBD5B|nr:acyltransferase [Paenibacillus sp. FSL R7-0331]